MTRTSSLFLSALLLVACPKDDDTGTQETDDTAPVGDCETDPGGHGLAEGSYLVSTDEAISLGCENAAGNGMHVHVGEDIPMDFLQTGACLEATSEPGTDAEMDWTGMTDGDTFELAGSVDFEYGTCVLLIEAVLSGTMTADNTFDYRTDATLSILEELSPDACSYVVGDTENHTFPELPCDWAWGGTGTLEE